LSSRFAVIGLFLIVFISGMNVTVKAAWETGLKAGFDSNIDRAIDGGKDDMSLSAYLSLGKETTGESRLDWSITSTIEGTAFNRYSDLSYGEITIAPGIVYFPYRLWSFTVSPFFQAKEVRDSDQSAIAFGGKVTLLQQIRPDFYLGQYYAYKNSNANVDTYSFKENAVGVLAGINLSKGISGELDYEFSHGDSFRALSRPASRAYTERKHSNSSGKGRYRTFSKAFGEFVIREPVDRHAIGIHIGKDWNKSFFSAADYTFANAQGDSGSSTSSSGFISLGYRF